MKDWAVRHPTLVAFAMAMWATYVALEIFETGKELGAVIALQDDADRMRSEALGG
jgi:hypothetical protein